MMLLAAISALIGIAMLGQNSPVQIPTAAATSAAAQVTAIDPTPRSQEVEVVGPAGTLAGTFVFPADASATHRVPAVVFITGSGPQDRDESLFGQKPFRVIAEALLASGIASIRCDDRGFAKSTGDFASATTFDFIDDAKAQVAWLRTQPQIDPAHIGVVGHSEGGLIGLLLSQSPNPPIGFAVLLAPPGLSGAEILTGQTADMYAQAKVDPGRSAEAISRHRAMLELVIADAPEDQIDAAIRALVDAQFACSPGFQPTPELIETSVKQGIAQMKSPWFRTFIALDPAPAIARIGVPMLILFGERDLQVSPARNLPPFTIGSANAPIKPQIEVIAGVNHLFQQAKTGLPDEYATIKSQMDPDVVKMIASWVVQTTRAASAPPAAVPTPSH